ncbi:MAG: NADH-quinone oxidoreductase subunit L [Anaerolineae bacterium]
MKTRRPVEIIAVATAAATALTTWTLIGQAGTSLDLLGWAFHLDGLGILLTLVAANIGLLTVIFSLAYIEKDYARYYAWVLLFIGAMIGLVLTSHLLLLFFFWEITALCSFALIAFESDNPDARAGGLRALVVTQIGGGGLLTGALVTYALTGSYQFDALFALTEVPLLVGLGFLLAAAAKSAQVPLHNWLPGAMEAPTPISALIHAATMVNAGVYLLARFYPAFSDLPGWAAAVMVLGTLTALLGAAAAAYAFDLKRILAYSTVSQLGYMVYAVGAGGLVAAQYHMLNHAVFKALLFLGAGAVIHMAGTRDIRDMGGRRPLLLVTFLIGAAGLMGLPPFNGFWSKDLIISQGGGLLPVVLIAAAGLPAFYTARMVWWVFFKPEAQPVETHPTPPAMAVPLTVLAVGTLLTWLAIEPVSAGELDLLHLFEHSLSSAIIVLPVVIIGALAWLLNRPATILMPPLARMAESDYGMVPFSRWVVRGIDGAASVLRDTQTGLLATNTVYILLTLIVLIVVGVVLQ